MNANMPRPLDDEAVALLQALQACKPEKLCSLDIVEQGLVFDEQGVFDYARVLMKAGEPVCVSSGLAGNWEGLAAQEFEIWLSSDPKELDAMCREVDSTIAGLVAIRSGLARAMRRTGNADSP
jgi:hypothetical protein